MVAIHTYPLTNGKSQVGLTFGEFRREVVDISKKSLKDLTALAELNFAVRFK